MRTLADSLTIFRALIGLPVIFSLSIGWLWLAWILTFTGGLTDFADGYLARKADGGTAWGAKLDPLADKILLTAPILWLTANGEIPLWATWMLFSRELLVTLWRSNDKKGCPASRIGKSKTILQFISVLLMIWPMSWAGQSLVFELHRCGLILFWLSLFAALVSSINYLYFSKQRI